VKLRKSVRKWERRGPHGFVCCRTGTEGAEVDETPSNKQEPRALERCTGCDLALAAARMSAKFARAQVCVLKAGSEGAGEACQAIGLVPTGSYSLREAAAHESLTRMVQVALGTEGLNSCCPMFKK
jgi:hypothetical protein